MRLDISGLWAVASVIGGQLVSGWLLPAIENSAQSNWWRVRLTTLQHTSVLAVQLVSGLTAACCLLYASIVFDALVYWMVFVSKY